MGRKYYAYGTYAENGILYTKDGIEIKDKEAYYDRCRENISKTSKDSYTSKGITYEFVRGTKYKRYTYGKKNW